MRTAGRAARFGRMRALAVRAAAHPGVWVALALLLFVAPMAAALGRSVPVPPPVIASLPDFRLTDQHGLAFGSAELRGKAWVAGFVFTSCPSVCPRLMERMAEIQHRTRNLGAAFHLVTITVDPENDTPERLAAFGRRFRASSGRWSLLTGDLAAIEATVVGGFKLAMGKDAESLFQIFHSERLVLVDAGGRIRGYYDASAEGVDDLVRAIGVVTNGG